MLRVISNSALVVSLVMVTGCGRLTSSSGSSAAEEESFITKLELVGDTTDVVEAEDVELETTAIPSTSEEYEVIGGNLLINGGFENHNLKPKSWKVFAKIDGWVTVSGAGVEVQNGVAGKAHEGNAKIELDSHGSKSNSAIVQEVKTSTQNKYRLSFAYSPRPRTGEGSNKVEVTWNDTVIATLAETGKGLTNTKWTVYSFDLDGADHVSKLGFRALGKANTYGGYIDAVSLLTLMPKVVEVDPQTVAPIVVDNSAAELVGHWPASTAVTGYHADNYVHNDHKDAANKTAAFAFTLPHVGYWQVLARWTQHPNRATNAVYKITHATGTDEVAVNQREYGGQWNELGAFKFDAGTLQSKIVLAAGEESDGYVIADAVKLVYLGTQTPSYALSSPIMLDNDSRRYVSVFGAWTNSNVVKQYEGIGYLHDANQHHKDSTNQDVLGLKRVVYTPDFAQAGKYRVLVRWTAHPNRATNALYVVSATAGQERYAVNQRLRGGEFHELGVFEFAAGKNIDTGSVTVQRPDDADGHVIADAVKFELVTE